MRIHTEVRGLSLFVKISGSYEGVNESMEKEWPVRKGECVVSEAKGRKNVKEQVMNWICLFICLLIKQDAK